MMTNLDTIQTVDTKYVSSMYIHGKYLFMVCLFFFPVYHDWLNDIALKLPSLSIRYRVTSALIIQHDLPVIFWIPVFREFSLV